MVSQLLSELFIASLIIPMITASVIFKQSNGAPYLQILSSVADKIPQENYSFSMRQSGARQLNVITSTITEIKTTTITKQTTIGFACAKLVNISGPCRRHRGYWVEEPIVLTFDDITDRLVDISYTPVFGIEITPTPYIIGSAPVHQYINADDSILTATMRKSEEDDQRQSRIFFREFANFFQRFFPPSREPTRSSTTKSSTTTITVTQERTKSITQTSFTTNTFFIQKCTPSPFPFKECRQHGHNSSSLPDE